MKRAWWWFLNPLEWLKSLYEIFGAKHPTASLVGVMIFGAVLAGMAGKIGAHQYNKAVATGTPNPASQSQRSIGPNSPNVIGSGNVIAQPEHKPTPPDNHGKEPR